MIFELSPPSRNDVTATAGKQVVLYPLPATSGLGTPLHIISLKHTCFLLIFYNIARYFWMIAWMKKADSFQVAKV